MTGSWVSLSIRDEIVRYVAYWADRTETPVRRIFAAIGLQASKYYAWVARLGQDNCHNARVPKDGWLLPEEKAAIIAFHDANLTEGYRRLAWMMNDQGIVAASPSSVRRVLKDAGRLRSREAFNSRNGKGFEQPLEPHEHWRTEISFIRIGGVFYGLCSFLDAVRCCFCTGKSAKR